MQIKDYLDEILNLIVENPFILSQSLYLTNLQRNIVGNIRYHGGGKITELFQSLVNQVTLSTLTRDSTT